MRNISIFPYISYNHPPMIFPIFPVFPCPFSYDFPTFPYDFPICVPCFSHWHVNFLWFPICSCDFPMIFVWFSLSFPWFSTFSPWISHRFPPFYAALKTHRQEALALPDSWGRSPAHIAAEADAIEVIQALPRSRLEMMNLCWWYVYAIEIVDFPIKHGGFP